MVPIGYFIGPFFKALPWFVTQYGECFLSFLLFLFLIKVPSFWRCLCPAQGPTQEMALPSPLGLQRLVNSAWNGLSVVLHSPLPLQQWGLSAGLGRDYTMARSWHCHDYGPQCSFWSRDGRKLYGVLINGIAWTLTQIHGESLKTTNVKMHNVWTLLHLGQLESYTKPIEIASFKMCSCCICLCLNQFILCFGVWVKTLPHTWGVHSST